MSMSTVHMDSNGHLADNIEEINMLTKEEAQLLDFARQRHQDGAWEWFDGSHVPNAAAAAAAAGLIRKGLLWEYEAQYISDAPKMMYRITAKGLRS